MHHHKRKRSRGPNNAHRVQQIKHIMRVRDREVQGLSPTEITQGVTEKFPGPGDFKSVKNSVAWSLTTYKGIEFDNPRRGRWTLLSPDGNASNTSPEDDAHAPMPEETLSGRRNSQPVPSGESFPLNGQNSVYTQPHPPEPYVPSAVHTTSRRAMPISVVPPISPFAPDDPLVSNVASEQQSEHIGASATTWSDLWPSLSLLGLGFPKPSPPTGPASAGVRNEGVASVPGVPCPPGVHDQYGATTSRSLAGVPETSHSNLNNYSAPPSSSNSALQAPLPTANSPYVGGYQTQTMWDGPPPPSACPNCHQTCTYCWDELIANFGHK